MIQIESRVQITKVQVKGYRFYLEDNRELQIIIKQDNEIIRFEFQKEIVRRIEGED